MRATFLCIIGLCVLVFTGAAAHAQTGQNAAIQSVIERQMQAIRADDFERAFEEASPNIRQVFRTPTQFGRMVVQGYPMVHRNAGVEFLSLRAEGDGWVQRLRLRDKSGAIHLLDYHMISVPDGWKINRVQLLSAAQLSV